MTVDDRLLAGVLDFATVPDLWPRLEHSIRTSRHLELSLAGVERANSAALALLLEGVALALRTGCRLHYRDIPETLLELARVSNVEKLLLDPSVAGKLPAGRSASS